MNDIFAPLYELLLYNESFPLIFDHLFNNGGYVLFAFYMATVPLLGMVIFYFIWRYPYGKIWHWLVWVGFLALFGIASDDGVIIATYLNQVFDKRKPETIEEIRAATIEAGSRRVRPALMTTATTLIALIPILMSTGRGSDIMIPMAIPSFGGMTIALITLFIVPVSYSWLKERELKIKR